LPTGIFLQGRRFAQLFAQQKLAIDQLDGVFLIRLESRSRHTRQYFPIHEAGMVKNTGSAIFDTFATVRRDQPLLFHWPDVELKEEQQADLKLLLGRMTYFGRAESWLNSQGTSRFYLPPNSFTGKNALPS
jgi:hypothetical protein